MKKNNESTIKQFKNIARTTVHSSKRNTKKKESKDHKENKENKENKSPSSKKKVIQNWEKLLKNKESKSKLSEVWTSKNPQVKFNKIIKQWSKKIDEKK